jgi:hypothetical protein
MRSFLRCGHAALRRDDPHEFRGVRAGTGRVAETVGFELYATPRQCLAAVPKTQKIKDFCVICVRFDHLDSVELWANRGHLSLHGVRATRLALPVERFIRVTPACQA